MFPVVKEQRLFERFGARFPAKYEHSRDDYGTNVFLRDASAQGARITTKERIFKNDNISLLVNLPDGFDPMVLHGKVMWAQEKSPNLWEAGLRFHQVRLMEAQRIFKYSDL